MRALAILFLALHFFGLEAQAFEAHEQLKVELVKPMGEFGFRAIGRGRNFTEMKIDCSKISEMGLKISLVNIYGKTSRMVLPPGKLGHDKYKCQEKLRNYFANVYSKRNVASQKGDERIVELRNKKSLNFL